MIYDYSAINQGTGETVRSTMTAASVAEAAIALTNSSYRVLSIELSRSQEEPKAWRVPLVRGNLVDQNTAIAAMILWELYLDEDRNRYENASTDPAPKYWPILREVREGDGFRALRQIILETLAPAAIKDCPADFDGCFDWEFCPDWMREKAHLYL